MRTSGVLRVLRRSVVALVSAGLLAAVGYWWFTYRTASDNLVTDDVITPLPKLSEEPETPRTDLTILLVGMDSRTDAQGNPPPREVLDALRAGEAGGEQNTDTMILVHVPADPARRAFAVSLPRDSYVDIAGGFGRHKLNSAYARAKVAHAADLRDAGADAATVERESVTAGRRNLIATVTALTGLRIDHYAEINLFGFSELTKAVGGVPVCLNAPVHDSYSGAEFPAGAQTISGVDALKFVRQRHGLPNGDLDRVRRQQAFLAGLANRVFSAGTLTDPGRVADLIDALTRSVVLNEGWDLLGFAQQVADLAGDRVEFHTIPTGRPDLPTPNDGSAVEVDPAQVQAFIRGLLSGGGAGSPPIAGQQPGQPPAAGQQPKQPAAGQQPEPPVGATAKPPVGARDWAPGASRQPTTLTAEPPTVRNLTQEQTEQPITAGGVPCVN